MSEVKHTSGPWSFRQLTCQDHGGMGYIEAGGVDIIHAGVLELSTEENQANARLIAAAPELLEALQITLALALIKWGNLDPDANRVFDQARAAIQKATA